MKIHEHNAICWEFCPSGHVVVLVRTKKSQRIYSIESQ